MAISGLRYKSQTSCPSSRKRPRFDQDIHNQRAHEACVLGTVSDRDAIEEMFYIVFFRTCISLQLFKNASTGIVAGMSSLLVVFVTGIVACMGFPTFVTDHGCVSSPPNMMIHMALD